jgi:mannitol/fructose-specific phosphotransferase system IIA component (Ntr-type)
MLFRPPHPLPFGEETGRLTSLFFLLVFPSANEHLHMLARLNRMLRLPGFVDDLLSAGGPAEMLDIVRERERELREPLRRGDSR